MPAFSVVVPTYNRLDVLPEVLAALRQQAGAPPFEVIVVDDGSSDGTASWLAACGGGLDLTAIRQENRGPAAARNAGVTRAKAPRVAFLGDDTVPAAGWLAAHAAAWERRDRQAGLAVIGRTEWHPRMRRTPFLDYINEYGLQFGYALIDDPEQVPFNFFYTSNLSLDRELLLAEPFNAEFPYAAWEDIEASYRLFRRGLRLVYEPGAIAAHDHPTDLGRFAVRQERAGYCAVVFYRLHPELGSFLGLSASGPPPLPGRGRQRLLEILARALQNTAVRVPRIWNEVLRFHYIRGLRRGWSELAGEVRGA